ncbi:protein kinase [Burkholderia multivorans]|uniref:leucine-rich repeat-containing protein kinase family protein n=6 Tax=Burkholderia multivorans TaxID=87883 RepID=UPI000DAB9448|nr:leucine-rich repeat-containing protein kinase family protein [Burkholderia multivorans]RAA25544.1 protein kinase [Burkholderia multivorans]RAA26278.1 protein kinase [Burkholderia multivorans]RAA30202.1 protein kinase [Burkholderia multivorans]RAA42941.1 protein kinase [Burkholderia multivorans]RAA49676.1 protein kinase [Burkholderia multivorans]
MIATLEQLRAGRLTGARQLKLACGLTEFPREIFELADTLEVLDLSGNALSSLPDDLSRLHRLRILFASDNRFTALPDPLGACPQLEMIGFKANRIRTVPGAALPRVLRWLILTDNAIDALPPEIGDCSRLQKLMLAGNRLQSLPDEMAACRALELVRLAANRLDTLPDWLLRLPRLAWLAVAGNPLGAASEAAASADAGVTDIDWASLACERKLGEGASGVIYRARWRADMGERPVAVKLFKGAVTSDGLPDCEMAACLHAGRHPNMIPVIGRVRGHPDGVHGLVMELVDPALTNLAGPPNFATCTRDVYADDVRFEPAAALRIARGIASVARHLHARGIMHGDLYAHNILHGHDESALLGDFGAASLYDVRDAQRAALFERLEVRAFGYLLGELLERCEPRGWAGAPALDALAAACLNEDVDARPSFAEIVDALTVYAA